MDPVEIVGITVSVLLSGLYSGSETALTALGTRGAQQLLEEQPIRHKRMKLWIERPYATLTAILIGNNLVNTAASALVASISKRKFDVALDNSVYSTGLAVGVGFATFLLLTFGEVIPKVLAKAYAKRLASPAIRFIWVSYWLFWPVTKFYTFLTRSMLRLVGGELAMQAPVTVDDIEFMVAMGTKDGSLDEDQERLLTSVFEYAATMVKEVMVPRVRMVAVPNDVGYSELLKTLVEAGHSRVPVFRDNVDEIVGVMYAKDVLRFVESGGSAEDFHLEALVRPPVFVPQSKKVDQLLHEFRESHVHLAIVVDEFGGTAGVVTLEDIIEEFFGEIQDEYDQEEPLLRDDGDGVQVADAGIRLDELEDVLFLEFPEDHDYESLGGFIVDQLEGVPEAGDELAFQDHRFVVLEAEPTHIVRVRIECPPEPDESDAGRQQTSGSRRVVSPHDG